ncbi:MAG TPA: TerC family protein [Fimbriimonadaceae bacterium]|nr:TerC family protein [Fimbriimonadaceae bacterium]
MHLIDWVTQPSAWMALVTLLVLEIVLGIDNIIFISILSNKLPESQQAKARQLGLLLALVSRILLLMSINWVKSATHPVFTLPFPVAAPDATQEALRHLAEVREISWRDLILGGGGLFLISKSVKEIHLKLEGDEGHGVSKGVATMAGVLIQIMVLDVVFSLDSVITAVGMADQLGVMIWAVVLAVGFMLIFAGTISKFVERHPTIKMLALSFLVLIGVNLVAEACGQPIPKGYTYFAMAFAVLVEMLNIKLRKNSEEPVKLREPYLEEGQ